jgi:acetyltransferase-like isoleucine patch superfamily enzyme
LTKSPSTLGPAFVAPKHFFILSLTEPLTDYLNGVEFVWSILDHLGDWIKALIKPNVAALRLKGGFIETALALKDNQIGPAEYNLDGKGGYPEVFVGGEKWPDAALILPGAFIADGQVEIGPGVVIESGAFVKGPTILGPKTQVRQGAYVRGQVYCLGHNVVGHATEAKNVLFLSEAKAGHFAYLGDSVLGAAVNLGAGTKLANLKMDDKAIGFKVQSHLIVLSRRKLGAIIGDHAETGCNSVTSPGALLGPGSRLAPNATAKAGFYPPFSRIGF